MGGSVLAIGARLLQPSCGAVTMFPFAGEIVPRAHLPREFEEFGNLTKHGVAGTIANRIPSLSLHLPPARKPWTSENARMGFLMRQISALNVLFDKALEHACARSRRSSSVGTNPKLVFFHNYDDSDAKTIINLCKTNREAGQ
jgi:hypothetical protein